MRDLSLCRVPTSQDVGETSRHPLPAPPDPLGDRALARRMMDSERYDPSPDGIDRFRQYGDPQ